ncbi:hypothetical protein SteCoe_10023 [Stentor coeruleus]|uniref:Histidine phosphatase family protein n=1 Tax=Stentor coeruleus TaxID=5963 RepID=A0A1R2CGG9_9CILI|nr:hypothetical protein SteCoe_10023 [Stentor coeruleus]
MELYIARHGQTVGNVERILQGQQGGELTELGVHQAQLLGERLKSVHFDAIFCSDLNRCQQTLGQIIPFHNYASPVFDERLREKSAGVLEGRPLGTTDALAKKNGVNPREYRPERGESWTDVQSRARNFLMELASRFIQPNGNFRILIVSHGGWIMEFINVIREIKGQIPVYANKSKNTAVYVYRFKKNGNKLSPSMVIENDTKHLSNI